MAPQTVPSERDRIGNELAGLRANWDASTTFFTRVLHHLARIESTALQLRAAPGDLAKLNDLFRSFQTVKGQAGAVGLTRMQELAHEVETLLDRCLSARHMMGAAETDAVLRAVDVLTALLRDLSARLAGKPGTSHEVERLALIAFVRMLGQMLARGTMDRVPGRAEAEAFA